MRAISIVFILLIIALSSRVGAQDSAPERVLATTGETGSMAAFAGRASSIDVAEAFKIENGLIRRVEMIGSSVPFHPSSDWPGGLSGR